MGKKATAPKQSGSRKTIRKKSGAIAVRKAATTVKSNAIRAREIGEALVTAGLLLQKGALFLDAMIERVEEDIPRVSRRRRRKRN
ncbi:MAG: hypothetical protein NVS1B14_07310 [Vulcanimicrobiaceae bacterium]